MDHLKRRSVRDRCGRKRLSGHAADASPLRRYLLGGAPPSLHTVRPLPDSETRTGMRWRARRQGATATSRVGQEWGRREGLRWLSVGCENANRPARNP
jgi:hypothetical protein